MNNLGRERKRKGRVDEMGGLNSILSLSSGNTQTIFLLSIEKSLQGCPNLIFSLSERTSLMALVIVDFPRLVLDII